MNKYSREAIMAVVAQVVESGFEPIDDRVKASGLDPYIHIVAGAIGQEAAEGTMPSAEVVESAAESNFLHGVLIGLMLAENEHRIDAAMSQMREDGGLFVAHPHFETPDDAERLGLTFVEFPGLSETRMARVNGPFTWRRVDDQAPTCQDGWLAVTPAGFMYAVDDAVVRASYAVPTP